MHDEKSPRRACAPKCNCAHAAGFPRRDLLKLAALGTVSTLYGTVGAAPLPPVVDDFEKLIPADKNLSPEWIRSLFERGEPERYAGELLRYIGMPIGGICCGQVYLGGDGRLWHWDIFNQPIRTGADHYAHPMEVESPIDLSFSLSIGSDREPERSLDRSGFRDITFRGEYPIGHVSYRDQACPVAVELEAFSPFCPLEVDDSSLPVVVMRFTLANRSSERVEGTLRGRLSNPVLLYSGSTGPAELTNRCIRQDGLSLVYFTAREKPSEVPEQRPDVVFDDFESSNYENWTVEGTAFGDGPIVAAQMPAYQGDVGAHGKRLVNSHNTRQGEDVRGGDAHTGVMTSKPFTIERNFINFLIGGGSHKGQTCLNLLVDGKVVASATGRDDNRLHAASFDVRNLQGKKAQLQIVDNVSGGWGNIGVDYIVFSDRPPQADRPLDTRPDWGDMTLALLDGGDTAVLDADDRKNSGAEAHETAVGTPQDRPRGSVGASFTLAPGERREVVFLVAWRFPNVEIPRVGAGHYYAQRFPSSRAAAEYTAANFRRFTDRTRLWVRTWYDSTLPYWLLDRTFINVSTLATSTCFRLSDGRFWGWEGVRCCPGTCTHVWHYAQAAARVLPELERILRERVDYGIAFQPDGHIAYRGEYATREAIDGQCGNILRTLREHQMSADDRFLRRIWPRVKQSVQYLIEQDGDANGLLEGGQYNTLDATWYGPISWISSMYVAALRAGAQMAEEMGDHDFARQCTAIAERGKQEIVKRLFNGEYFYQIRDPAHPEAIGSGIGCHIDQALGDFWTHQLGLPDALPKEETVVALRHLWRYNFAPDVGPYREKYITGRWYAMPGEAGLIMCTFPHGGEQEARGGKPGHTFAGYLNECMNGFEYQAAAHMISEGLVEEGLAVARAIHDRYHPSKRNPYNEIECGDHYARSMASYAVYLALCGYYYHGPKQTIGFAPRIHPERFKAAFIAAEGWGTFTQEAAQESLQATFTVRHGRLRLRKIRLAPGFAASDVRVTLGERSIPATLSAKETFVEITLARPVEVEPQAALQVELA
ncbi:hypothetical protein JCM19992_31500 [Thermostilla marina]